MKNAWKTTSSPRIRRLRGRFEVLKLSPQLELLEELEYPWQGWGFAHGEDGFFAPRRRVLELFPCRI